MKRRTKFALGALCLLAAAIASRPVILNLYSKTFLNTGPNDLETPATVGLAYVRLKIPSGSRVVDAYVVRAPAACQPRVSLLIFHGVMETISEWVLAQKFLYDHCVSSLVFDYSGHGDSSRPGTVGHLNEDAIPAYAAFASMGNGPMLESIRPFHSAAILCGRGECILISPRRGSQARNLSHFSRYDPRRVGQRRECRTHSCPFARHLQRRGYCKSS
jgi:hypothetical protein